MESNHQRSVRGSRERQRRYRHLHRKSHRMSFGYGPQHLRSNAGARPPGLSPGYVPCVVDRGGFPKWRQRVDPRRPIPAIDRNFAHRFAAKAGELGGIIDEDVDLAEFATVRSAIASVDASSGHVNLWKIARPPWTSIALTVSVPSASSWSAIRTAAPAPVGASE